MTSNPKKPNKAPDSTNDYFCIIIPFSTRKLAKIAQEEIKELGWNCGINYLDKIAYTKLIGCEEK